MIRSIHNISVAEILPPSIAVDENIYAIAKSLDEHLHNLAFDSKYVLHLPRLNELNHDMLDVLAEQFHLDFYEPEGMTLETKRNLIRNSILDHRIKGTPAAVENLLNKIVGSATVKEWYEYGGKTFFFKVNVKELKDMHDNGETFIRLINATKNCRSWLDALDFDLSKSHPDETLHVGQLHNFQGNITINTRSKFTAKQNLHVVQSEIVRGKQSFALNIVNAKSKLKLRAGFINLISGRIRFNADIDDWDELKRRLFDEYLKRRWEEFKNNAVIKHYSGDEGEIDNPDDEEFFPVEQDFLRLYWKFPDSERIRYTTHYRIKDTLTAADILNVSNSGEGILLHSKLKVPTSGILRALYVQKTETKIL